MKTEENERFFFLVFMLRWQIRKCTEIEQICPMLLLRGSNSTFVKSLLLKH